MFVMPKTKPADPELVAEALKRIKTAKAKLLFRSRSCFYGILALKLKEIASTRFPTMATNGRDLFFNPVWTMSLTPQYCEGVVAHEVLHCALNHFLRAMGRDPELWNIAGDYVINLILKDSGFELPPNCLFDERFRNMSVEEVYRILEKEQKEKRESQKPDDGSGDQSDDADDDQSDDDGQSDDDADDDPDDDADDGPDDGSGSGDASDDSDDDQSDDDGSGSGSGDADADDDDGSGSGSGDASDDDDSDGSGSGSGDTDADGNCDPDGGYDEDWRNADSGQMGGVLPAPRDTDLTDNDIAGEWAAAVNEASIAARQRGSLPASLTKLVAEIVNPELPWITKLADYVDRTARSDYDWTRTSRRYLPQGLIMPGIRGDELNAVIVIDNSISINFQELSTFLATVSRILTEYDARVTVLYCDTRVNKVEEYESSDLPLEPYIYRGGGTDFRPPFEYVVNEGLDPKCLIYLTDLVGSFPERMPEYPVLWITNNKYETAPWGETIYMKC